MLVYHEDVTDAIVHANVMLEDVKVEGRGKKTPVALPLLAVTGQQAVTWEKHGTSCKYPHRRRHTCEMKRKEGECRYPTIMYYRTNNKSFKLFNVDKLKFHVGQPKIRSIRSYLPMQRTFGTDRTIRDAFGRRYPSTGRGKRLDDRGIMQAR